MKLDFSGKSQSPQHRVPNYLVGRDRRYVGYWVFGIGLLVLMVFRFGDVLELTTALAKYRDQEPIDTRAPLPAYREPLPHGAVSIPLDDADRDPAELLAMLQTEKVVDEEKSAQSPTKSEPPKGNEFERREAAQNVPAPGYAPGVDHELLKTVKDKDWNREAEAPVWYHLFDVVIRADERSLSQQATPVKTYRMLYEQSKYYRGRPITIEGNARWYREHGAVPENIAGLARYFEIGVQMDESESNPVFVYCAELPAEWPRGKPDPADPQRYLIKQPVSVTAVGYKNFSYSATDTLRYAPLVIAKTVQVLPTKQAGKGFSLGDVGWPAAMLVAGLLIMLPLLWVAFGKKRPGFTLGDPSPRIELPANVQDSVIQVGPPHDE